MKVNDKIKEAILMLNSKGCADKDLMICYSPRLKEFIEDEVRQYLNSVNNITTTVISNITHIHGIIVNPNHFKDEIVVYHKELACLNPKYIVIIKPESFEN
jgi:hypothetical protein